MYILVEKNKTKQPNQSKGNKQAQKKPEPARVKLTDKQTKLN